MSERTAFDLYSYRNHRSLLDRSRDCDRRFAVGDDIEIGFDLTNTLCKYIIFSGLIIYYFQVVISYIEYFDLYIFKNYLGIFVFIKIKFIISFLSTSLTLPMKIS